jgi:hypothetical protein
VAQNIQPIITSASFGVTEVVKNSWVMKTDLTWEHDVLIDETTRVR